MALSSPSLFLYGFTLTVQNQNIDFVSSNGGPTFTATIAIGEYSLTSLLVALQAAMQAADPANTYTCTADRSYVGGTQNRVTIQSSSSYFQILFGTGPTATTSLASVIGFNPVNYTGATTYTGSVSAGTALMPEQWGYNYEDPIQQGKVFGAVNISAAGVKETVVFNIQQFLGVNFKYEPASTLPYWNALFAWMITQKPFDFTPQISSPNTFYQVTLEKTEDDSKGMAFKMKEMLPNFPNTYQTGPLIMRIVLDYTTVVFEA